MTRSPLPVLMALACIACSTNTRPERPPVMTHAGLDIPAEQLRIRTMQQAADLAGIVEVSADDILAHSTDAPVRQNALLWKANMITAIENSAIQFDPLISYMDLYALCYQADDFFRRGAGAGAFGPHQERATRATALAISHMQVLTADLAPDSVRANRAARIALQWAAAHPIESFAFARQSMSTTAAAAITDGDMSAFAAVGRLDQSLADINERAGMLLVYMPRQARWEAQLLTEQMLGATLVDTAMVNFGSMARNFGRLTSVAESLPGLVDWQRRATMDAITGEREAVLLDLTAERIATLSAVGDQLTRLLTSIRDERVAALRDVEGMLTRTVQQSQSTVDASIDHLVWRLVQLATGLVVVMGIGVGAVVLALRPRRA